MAYARWDRDSFERAGGGRETVERDYYDERDYYGRQGEVDIHEDSYRRTYASPPPRERSRGPMRESERIFFEDRHTSNAPVPYRPRREDVRYFDDRETVVDRQGDMVPYRRREDEREIDIKVRRESRPFERPQFVRRQSSLDTHDRRPLPRYGDRIREEVVIPAPPRRRSPPRFVERDYEDISVADPDYYHDEGYHPYREHEREIYRRRYPPPPPQGEEIVYEREEIIKSEYPKRGKTRMPRRLINIRAIMDLGYQFEEEEKTIIILKALGKDNIDEVIRISKDYNATPMPPPPLNQPIPPPVEEEIIKRKTEIVREDPSLASSSSSSRSSSPTTVVSKSTKKSHKTHRSSKSKHVSHSRAPRSEHRHRSKSTRRHRSASFSSATTGRELVIREDFGERNRHERPYSTALIVPRDDDGNRHYRRVEDELRALELERKALRLEREAHEKRGHDVIIEKDYKDGSVEVKKERNGKMKLILNR